MRKIDFVQAIQRIVFEIKATELVRFLEPIINRSAVGPINAAQQESLAALVFESQAGYRDLMKDDRINKILEELGVSRLLSPASFSELITIYKTAGTTANIYAAATSFGLYCSLYEFLKWLLAFQSTFTKFLSMDEREKVLDGDNLLELEIIDLEETGIDITRLLELLSALENLRIQISILLSLPESHLRIRYVESGSIPIHIHVEGAAEVIDSLKTLFTELWTRIQYRMFDKIDRRNQSVEKQFSLIDQIQERVKTGAISSEDGERFKQRILAETQRLLNSGTILEDAQVAEPVSKQKLLAEGMGIKLLGTGGPPVVP